MQVNPGSSMVSEKYGF